MTKAYQYLVSAQRTFILFLLPCVFLMPEIFREDLGISNYGIHAATIIPYSCGFLTSAYFTWKAGQELRKNSGICRQFGEWLSMISILLITLLLVPDIRINAIRFTHLAIGMILFATELSLSVWLVVHLPKTSPVRMIMALQILFFVTSLFSLIHLLPFEAPSQLLFQICFTSCCSIAARDIKRKPRQLTV